MRRAGLRAVAAVVVVLAGGVVDGTAWVLLGGPTAGLSVSDTAQMLELD